VVTRHSGWRAGLAGLGLLLTPALASAEQGAAPADAVVSFERAPDTLSIIAEVAARLPGEYEATLEIAKDGVSGIARTSQSRTLSLKAQEIGSLAFSSFSIASGDIVTVTLSVKVDGKVISRTTDEKHF